MTEPKPPVPWGKFVRLEVEQVVPNPWNPNKMTPEELDKEAASFERFGFVNPIIVRNADGNGIYQIVDGEQRWRTAKRLGMELIDAYDISPIGTFEAQQLTYILNELRGQPQEDKLAELLKGLLAQSTLEDLVAVMPLTKTEFAKAAKLPDFDWAGLEEKNRQAATWKERVFRLPPEAAETLDTALSRAREGAAEEIQDWQALESIAAAFLTS